MWKFHLDKAESLFCNAGMEIPWKYFLAIVSVRLGGMKKWLNTCLQRKIKRTCKQIQANTRWKTVPPCQDEIWFPLVIVGWNPSRLNGLKFYHGKLGLCNHHLKDANYLFDRKSKQPKFYLVIAQSLSFNFTLGPRKGSDKPILYIYGLWYKL